MQEPILGKRVPVFPSVSKTFVIETTILSSSEIPR
jgi:hypothetical protein